MIPHRLIGYNHLKACAVRSSCRFIRAAHHHHHHPHDSTCDTPVFAISSSSSSSSSRWFQYVCHKQQSYHTRVLDCYASMAVVVVDNEKDENDDELLLSIQRKIAQEMSARHFQDALHSVAQLDHLIHQMKARTETKQKENAHHAMTCQEERPTNDESAAKAAEKVRHDTLIQARKITSLSVYIHRQYASNYFLMKQWDDCLEHCDKIFALEREIESLQLSNHLFYDMNVACMIKSQVYQAHQKWDMALKYKNFLIEKRLRPALKVAGENASAELMSTDLSFQLQDRAKLHLAMGGEEHMILALQDTIESMNLRPSASGQELLQFLINNTKTSSK